MSELKRNLILFVSCSILGIIILISQSVAAQTAVDHWETVVYDSMIWRYKSNADPGNDWSKPAFNDQSWAQGRGGFGYGDNDDRTIIGASLSVFLRKKFTITNRDQIREAILHLDYDDGFIAYLNGVEIARSNMGNQITVAYTQASTGLHEALLYQGQPPEGFVLTTPQLNALVDGENTLAVQVHNENIGSSDLTSNVFFSVGISDNSVSYLPTPSWFIKPDLFESSNLPIINIRTNGLSISDDPRIIADMGIVDNGVGIPNLASGPFNNFNGKISIETRGESSQGLFPKKSYRIETQDALGNNLNVALLGMPPENDWVLYAPYTDKTMLRDVLTYKLGRDMGRYAPRTRFVELVLNGIYQGVYVLIEKIKVDKNRVDIATLNPGDISGDELTGGYLLRVDKIDANDYPGWHAIPFPQLPGENLIAFQYYDPNGQDMVDVQRNYIKKYMVDFQSALSMLSFGNPEMGYRRFLDVPAAIDFMLVNEIGKNVDGYIFSTYLYKEKDKQGQLGKLVMGPLWDFNLAYGNVDYWSNAQVTPGWMWNDQYRMFWFRRLMQDPYFASSMKCRWQELRSSTLTNEYFTDAIDSMAIILKDAQVRNYKRWPILGTYIWPNQFVGYTYEEEVAFLKHWTLNRLQWMDQNMPGNCELITSINEEGTTDNINVFPNPFDKSVTIRKDDTVIGDRIIIRDLLGREVKDLFFTGDEIVWDGTAATGLQAPDGIYWVSLIRNGKIIMSCKIIRIAKQP
jgi:hypothetical protein